MGGDLTQRAKVALHSAFKGAADSQGYVGAAGDNLVPGVRLEQFEVDLSQGDGKELESKFKAIHSSSALAVNCFAPFRSHPERLPLLGKHGARTIAFEKRLTVVPGRKPANLDVWVERSEDIVAIESKLLEYLRPKQAAFAPEYDRLKPPFAEAVWWEAYEGARTGEAQCLDRAQLIKHYLGLRRHQQAADKGSERTLLYLFWEPLNWLDLDMCLRHREEIDSFAKVVAGASIRFRWMSYNQLWSEWDTIPALREHLGHLRERYTLEI